MLFWTRTASLTALFILLSGWGFFAHQKINRIAVFSLPPEMMGFYKEHIQYLTENAVNPDKRRYVNEYEAPRHYIDLDVYGDSALWKLPRYWQTAVDSLTEDTLNAYGIVPWHIHLVIYQLTQAFMVKDAEKILRYSADLGHYIGDAHVPLHTTENYNGQLTGQYGIHGFWESRLPELFFDDYDLFVGKAKYLDNTQLAAWGAVRSGHLELERVLGLEKELTRQFPEGKKYSYEQRGASMVRVYSYDYSNAYHRLLDGMVERQLRRAIKMTADCWYTAWVNAGQPDLMSLESRARVEEVLSLDTARHFRDHESGIAEE